MGKTISNKLGLKHLRNSKTRQRAPQVDEGLEKQKMQNIAHTALKTVSLGGSAELTEQIQQ